MTERRPFDPSRIRRRPTRAGREPQAALLSVRQVNELVRAALVQGVPPDLHVLGEIGNFSRPASGHLYFTLRDRFSELQCVMWRSTAARLRFQPEAGLEVIATGELEVYEQRGRFQMTCRKLEPRGMGALEVAFRQLKERLEREGLFDPQRKRILPWVPQRIAIVTSPTGAAIRDILRTLARRFPSLEVLVYPVRVQGDGAAAEIAAAIAALNHVRAELGGVDALIVGRGGGSLEDLWAFNEEVVARAIASSAIPVISAVGHEVDVTISDLVADVRASTPTAAAELVAPQRADLLATVAQLVRRSERRAGSRLELARADLRALLAAEPFSYPAARLRRLSQQIDEIQLGALRVLAQRIHRHRAKLRNAETLLLRFSQGRWLLAAARALDLRSIRCERVLRQRLSQAERGFAVARQRLERRGPQARLVRLVEHVGTVAVRMRSALRLGLRHALGQLEARVAMIAACDPRQVLRRGYSISRDRRTGAVIRTVSAIRGGQRIRVEVADGEFLTTADDPRQPQLFE